MVLKDLATTTDEEKIDTYQETQLMLLEKEMKRRREVKRCAEKKEDKRNTEKKHEDNTQDKGRNERSGKIWTSSEKQIPAQKTCTHLWTFKSALSSEEKVTCPKTDDAPLSVKKRSTSKNIKFFFFFF